MRWVAHHGIRCGQIWVVWAASTVAQTRGTPGLDAPGSLSVWAVPVGRSGRPAVQINCAAGAYLKSGALTLLLWPMRTCEAALRLSSAVVPSTFAA